MTGNGPAPTPTEILKLRGSRVPERRPGEVNYEIGVPTCPAWFKGEARAEWRRFVKQLQAVGSRRGETGGRMAKMTRTAADRQRLALSCLAVALAAWVAVTWAVHMNRLPGLRGWWPGAAGFWGHNPP